MNRFRSRGANLLVAMVFATLVVGAGLTYFHLYRLRKIELAVDQSREVLIELKALLATLVNAETGQRGYLITGQPDYLKPYERAEQTVNDQMQRVRAITAGNPLHARQTVELDASIKQAMHLIRQSVITRQTDGFEAARATVLTGQQKAAMDDVRSILTQMENEERRILKRHGRQASVSYWTALLAALATAGTGVALVGLVYWLVRRDRGLRESYAADLKEANERLENRVRERTGAIGQANHELRTEIEERKAAEQQARLFAQELQRSNRELEEFAAVASHDLQEPLRKIQAFGDRLRGQCENRLDARSQDYLERMLHSAGRMRKLIDDLLAYARLSTTARPFVAVDLNEVARQVSADLEGRMQQSGGDIVLEDLPTLLADPVQMRQLLQNLIGNALKFHRPDSPPRVSITSRILTPDPHSSNGAAAPYCEISISDNGIGFEPAYGKRIFEMFQRLHGAGEYEGTGMGLAICRKIVERHHGSIFADSEPGKGSRFVVRLPLEQPVLGTNI